MDGACCVGCAVEVLGAGIAEVDCFRVDDGAGFWFGFVVDYGCVGAGGGDGVEGEAGEVSILSAVTGIEVVFLYRTPRGFTYDRICSSLSAAWTSSSFVPFSTSSSSSQAKYLLKAAPSRTWHARIPSSSVSFLIALASPTGLRSSSTLSSPPSSRLKAQDALVDIMNFRRSGFRLIILISSSIAS